MRNIPAPQPCQKCGEMIRWPIARPGSTAAKLIFICSDCYGDEGGVEGYKRDAAASDIRYHGGRFSQGEW